MNTDYRYQLENPKVTGRRQQKFQCPNCGRQKCFVRYVDTHNDGCYVADNVGKCDHQHSCGYHYKPSEYFRDNQWATEPVATLSQHCQPKPLPPFQPMPSDYVLRCHSTQSTLWQWLTNDAAPRLGIKPENLEHVFHDYMLGATRSHDVIFWQIDQQGLVHGGHIMQYATDGHRHGYQGWVHTRLIRRQLLPPDWQLYQCHFGQQLLCSRPHDHVCIVESEKTALLMAALKPQYVWLATAGCSGLTAERTACLKGRRVTLFPDSGCLDKWSRVMNATQGIRYNVYNGLEQYPPNTDLCDLLFTDEFAAV